MDELYLFENRGSQFIFHFLVFMVSGLRLIPEKAFIGINGIKKKVKIHFDLMPNELIYREICNRINDSFEYIENFEEFKKANPECKIIKYYGEHVMNIDNNPNTTEKMVSPECFTYLRKLLMKDYKQPELPTRKIYITRRDSHLLLGNKIDGNARRRQILNDDEVKLALEPLGFEYIQLENYGLMEKMKIFSEADTIVSPNGGGLTFLIFANPKTKVIEFNTRHPHQVANQFREICQALNLEYKKLYADQVDNMDNMRINVEELVNEINKI